MRLNQKVQLDIIFSNCRGVTDRASIGRRQESKLSEVESLDGDPETVHPQLEEVKKKPDEIEDEKIELNAEKFIEQQTSKDEFWLMLSQTIFDNPQF